MSADTSSLLLHVRAHDQNQIAFGDNSETDAITVGSCLATAERLGRALSGLGLRSGDAVATTLPAGADLAALVLASWEFGLRLTLVEPTAQGAPSQPIPSCHKLLICPIAGPANDALRCISFARLEQAAIGDDHAPVACDPARAELAALTDDGPVAIGAAALLRSVENFARLVPVAPGSWLSSGSTPYSLPGVFMSTVVPLALGLSVRVIDSGADTGLAIDAGAFDGVDLCELPASTWAALAAGPRAGIAPKRCTLICGSGTLDAAAWERVERDLGRRVERGFGTVQSGFWAVPTGQDGARIGSHTPDIRPLRSPLHLAGGAGSMGEIVLRERDRPEAMQRTGVVGWQTDTGRLEIAGHLSDVVVRGGHSFLLSDHNRALQRCGVRASHTFRENGASPTDRAICVVLGDDATGADARGADVSSDAHASAPVGVGRVGVVEALRGRVEQTGAALADGDASLRPATPTRPALREITGGAASAGAAGRSDAIPAASSAMDRATLQPLSANPSFPDSLGTRVAGRSEADLATAEQAGDASDTGAAGALPGCVDLDTALRSATRAWTGGVPVVDRTLVLSGVERLPGVEVLRSVVNGTAGKAVVSALTARRFRRNPAYNEAGLAAAVDRALLGNGRLEFLMFWGCGPRRYAGEPDRAAVDALGALLAAVETAVPGLRAHAHVICTDLHATNNGHSEVHYRTYFSEIAALAAGLEVTFEMESVVWARGGLSKAKVSALEETPGFATRWAGFALRDRFVHQATRHSKMTDKVAAARHYYATCLLERDVLKSMFAESVFLTYNGPDFNECFPDLPTLYVYPGPRGPNDKPWFVDVVAEPADRSPAEVAAA